MICSTFQLKFVEYTWYFHSYFNPVVYFYRQHGVSQSFFICSSLSFFKTDKLLNSSHKGCLIGWASEASDFLLLMDDENIFGFWVSVCDRGCAGINFKEIGINFKNSVEFVNRYHRLNRFKMVAPTWRNPVNNYTMFIFVCIFNPLW